MTTEQQNHFKSVLDKDCEIKYPCVDIISASAGSGKTYTMAMRLAQFLLSNEINNNNLKQILAITFTKLAAKELKERLIVTLKKLALNDSETKEFFAPIISIPAGQIPSKAEAALMYILSQYSDLQVKTIDSFFSRVFRTSAHDYGLYADCEITFRHRGILKQAFEELSRKVFSDSRLQKQFDQLTEMITTQTASKDQSKFLWDPFQKISRNVIGFYQSIQKQKKYLYQTDQVKRIFNLKRQIQTCAEDFLKLIQETEQAGYNINKRFLEKLKNIEQNNLNAIISSKIYDKVLNATQKKNLDQNYPPLLNKKLNEFNPLCMEYLLADALNYYYPYVTVYQQLNAFIRKIQRDIDEVPLADLHQYIRGHLSETAHIAESLHSIYERLGETLYHYMIDEFQDTAPVHWGNLLPLIENGLANGGSLFVVGDTKQSIYAFNDADWRILRGLIDEANKSNGKTFNSVSKYSLRNLDTNYRSGEVIVEFNRYLFHEHIPSLYNNPDDANHRLALQALTTGGLRNYEQKPCDKNTGKGYVEVRILQPEDDFNKQLTDTVHELIKRGAPKKEIAVITYRNEDVTEISNGLKMADIDCISYSSLDIRKQSLTGEILSLLAFLDSPVDNLAFSRFLLGDIFGSISRQTIEERRQFIFQNRGNALYTAFREKYHAVWSTYFEPVFNQTGYLTPYDLVCGIFTVFKIYKNFPHESATLTKFLETVKAFEQNGRNTLKEFLSSSGEDDDDSWNILVSPDLDAVRVMTTHKVKGLDFGYVIAVFYDNDINSKGGLYFTEQKDHTEVIHITKPILERIDDFSKFVQTTDHPYRFITDLHYKRILTEIVEQFNLRYVTLTRPKHELYVFGVYTDKKDKSEKPKTGKTKEKDDPKAGTLDWLDIPEKIRGKKEPIQPDTTIKAAPLHFVYPDKTQISENFVHHKARNDERYRGDNIHFILSKIDYVPTDPVARFREIVNEFPLPYDYIPTENDFASMAAIISRPEMKKYFEPMPGRIIKNEQDFTDAEGTRRIDRLVIDPQEVTIIDYKTGSASGDDDKKYDEQIRLYHTLISAFYPGRAVKGILAYIDQNRIREVL